MLFMSIDSIGRKQHAVNKDDLRSIYEERLFLIVIHVLTLLS